MSAIIYDFRAISAKLRKQRIDDWWQPAKPEPEPQAAKLMPDQDDYWTGYAERLIFC
jgi:hypothetical protein